jgi:hypothetical protein
MLAEQSAEIQPVTERLQCASGGGVLLMDVARLEALKKIDFIMEEWDPLTVLSMAVDPYGETDQNEEQLPPEQWKTIWREETQRLLDMVNGGEAAFFVVNDGEYWLDLNVDSPRPQGADLVEHRSRLEIPSGTLAMAHSDSFFTNFPAPKDLVPPPFRYRELSVPPGWYTVSIFAGKPADVTPWGRYRWTFGTINTPVIHVRLERGETAVQPFGELLHLEYFPPDS